MVPVPDSTVFQLPPGPVGNVSSKSLTVAPPDELDELELDEELLDELLDDLELDELELEDVPPGFGATGVP